MRKQRSIKCGLASAFDIFEDFLLNEENQLYDDLLSGFLVLSMIDFLGLRAFNQGLR